MLVAPTIFDHVDRATGLDCHCTVHVPVPPFGVAESVILPPTQIVGAVVTTDTVGSATTTTLAVLLVVWQPRVDWVTMTR